MEQKRKEKLHSRILLENPYDIETILESLHIASAAGKEIHFMDKIINQIRNEPKIDTTEMCYKVLKDLNLLKLEN
jgi:hypothetical protein